MVSFKSQEQNHSPFIITTRRLWVHSLSGRAMVPNEKRAFLSCYFIPNQQQCFELVAQIYWSLLDIKAFFLSIDISVTSHLKVLKSPHSKAMLSSLMTPLYQDHHMIQGVLKIRCEKRSSCISNKRGSEQRNVISAKCTAAEKAEVHPTICQSLKLKTSENQNLVALKSKTFWGKKLSYLIDSVL